MNMNIGCYHLPKNCDSDACKERCASCKRWAENEEVKKNKHRGKFIWVSFDISDKEKLAMCKSCRDAKPLDPAFKQMAYHVKCLEKVRKLNEKESDTEMPLW